jgi:thymidylate synthase ThyX
MNRQPTSRPRLLAPWTWTHLKTWEFVVMTFTIYGVPLMLAFLIIAMCTGGSR